MPNSDTLIATRKRRANAGSRLKQLLQAEEHNYGGGDGDDDDENVDLLFQEDEDDKEFNVGDEDKYGYVSDQSDNDQDDENEGIETDNGQRSGSEEPIRKSDNKLDEEEEQEDQENDEMFSDSDEDSGAAGSESDEGEKELQKQERVKKRAAQKKSKQAPQIKIRQPTIKKTKPKSQSPAAETLLSLSRRSSSRSAAVQNKLQLVTRLKDEEHRRKNMKQVTQRIEYVEMTQEEKLAEAVETEKHNITQLNKYKEQEVDKQAKRRALQLSKRVKIQDMVSFKSSITEVPLIQEIKYEAWLQTRDKLSKKDRRGRKSDKQKRLEEEERLKEIEKKNQLEELERLMRLKRESLGEQDSLIDVKRVKIESKDELDDGQEEKKSEPNDDPISVKQITEEPNITKPEATTVNNTIQPDEILSKDGTIELESSPPVCIKLDSNAVDSQELTDSKTVRFEITEPSPAPVLTRTIETSVEPIEIEPVVYEGPQQKVGYNLISFESATVDEIKRYLFGPDSLLPSSRRSKNIEPLFTISNNLSMNKSTTTKIVELPNFSILDTFPEFGTYSMQVKQKAVEQTTTKLKINIQTPAPTGITIPSTGVKKTCLITGKPCVYFDPKSGIPYSSVDAYKYIQKLESNSGFYWVEFHKGGGYVGGDRHAKDVPEGFDD